MQEKVRFKTNDGQMLAGVLHTGDAGAPRAYALFAHCFTCTKNIRAATNIADSLCAEGIAVLRFDFTGLGQSEGEFAHTNFSSNVSDLLAAADYLADAYQAPEILVGHSLGGTACLAAAGKLDSVKAVATIGSPADAEHILGLLEDNIEIIEQKGEARVNLGGVPFTVRKDFVDDARSQSVRDGIRSLRKALLVMHSPVDALVPIAEAARIYASALHPKSFVSLDDADHLLSKARDSQYAASVLAAWAGRYVDQAMEDIPQAPFQQGAVVAEGRSSDMFRVSINADGHQQFGDEPAEFGGQDSGPTPYDYLSAALASCTVMTINMYARHKKIPLDSVRARVMHGKIHAIDCVECETKSGKIDQFNRTLEFNGELDESQRARLLEIADRCPVHRSLHSEVDIVTELKL